MSRCTTPAMPRRRGPLVPPALLLAFPLVLQVLTACTLPKAAAGGSPPPPRAVTAYRLSVGDSVNILVFDEPELSVTARIDGSGAISYPLLGELEVAGLTSEDLERLIREGLKGPYLVDPKVSVSIDQYRQFYIMGQVNRPGSYPYAPGLTVRRAISIAGGFTSIAARRGLLLTPEDRPDQEIRVTPTDAVGPGDTLLVKESLF